MLAAQRFNRFTLNFGIGHDFLEHVIDSYFLFAYSVPVTDGLTRSRSSSAAAIPIFTPRKAGGKFQIS